MQAGVDTAEKQAYRVLAQEAVAGVASLEIKRQSSGHWPTLDLVGTYGTTRDTGSLQSGVGRDITTSQLALQLAIPLYQGGGISSREREAAANYLRAREDLQNARRTAALTTRQTYLAVINGIAQVGALEQALTSSQSALPAALMRRRSASLPRSSPAWRIAVAASATCTAAPACRARRVASAKLYMCGPTITGAPAASASIRFWPPSGAKEPPITA